MGGAKVSKMVNVECASELAARTGTFTEVAVPLRSLDSEALWTNASRIAARTPVYFQLARLVRAICRTISVESTNRLHAGSACIDRSVPLNHIVLNPTGEHQNPKFRGRRR